jgi:hypothetical protein
MQVRTDVDSVAMGYGINSIAAVSTINAVAGLRVAQINERK